MTSHEFLIDALATYRLTRLIYQDEITAPMRAKAFQQVQKLPKPVADKLAYLLTCPWCISVYAATVLIVLRKTHPELAAVLTGVLASSAVAGAISERL